MGRDIGSWSAVQEPIIAPAGSGGGGVGDRDDHWRSFDNTVNAVSFGFVATAILISMFLIMAIFERFLRQRSPPAGDRSNSDLEAHVKLHFPSPKMTVYSKGVSVLMPGEEMPTYIAHHAPAPAPCPPERVSRPLYHQNMNPSSSSTSGTVSQPSSSNP